MSAQMQLHTKHLRLLYALICVVILGIAPGFAAAQQEVKVALLAPQSGPFARQGQLMKIGAELAIQDINAQGGIKSLGGASMKLIVEDAGDSIEKAKNAAQRLVAQEKGLVAVTGAWLSSFTLAASEVTERVGLPLLTLSYADQITARGFKYVLQTSAVSSSIAANSIPSVISLAESSAGRKPKSVAVISDSTAVAQAFIKPLREGGFEGLGLKLLADEVYTPPLADASTMIQKVRTSRPDFLIIYSANVSDMKLIMEKLNEFGLGKGRIPVIAPGAHNGTPEILKALGPELLEGLIFIVANWTSKEQHALLPTLIQRSGEPWMTQDTMSTYGDMWLIKDALERAKSTDRDKVMAELKKTNINDGAANYFLGDGLKFNETGRRVGAPVVLVQWQGGRPVTVSPTNHAIATPYWAKK